MRGLTFLLLFFACGSVLSQGDSVRYRFLFNDPYDIPNYSIYLSPVSMQMGGMNLINTGPALGFNVTIEDLITVEGEGMYSAYFDYNHFTKSIQEDYDHLDVDGESINQDFLPGTMLQGSVGLIVSDQSRTDVTNVALASSQTGNIIVTTVMPVDVVTRRLITVRGGAMWYTMKYTPGFLADDYYLEAADGTQFYQTGHVSYSDVDYVENQWDIYWDRTEVLPDDDFSLAGWSTQISAVVATAGFTVTKIRNMAVETDFGKRAQRAKSWFYMDLMYGVSMQATPIQFYESDVTNPSGIGTNVEEYDVTGTGENNIDLFPFGLRMGFAGQGLAKSQMSNYAEKDELSRLFNFGYKMEAGLLPGPRFRTFYFSLGLNWPLVSF